MWRGVHDLDVVGDDEFFEALRDFFGEAGLEIEQQFIGEAEDVQVALHFAFGGGDGGVATFAGAEFFDVVGDLAVEEAGAVGADEAKAGAKTEIEDAGGLAERGMFREPVVVMRDDFGAV
jgi:hypothetical protein